MLFEFIDIIGFILEVLITLSFFKLIAPLKRITFYHKSIVLTVVIAMRTGVMFFTENQILSSLAGFGLIVVLSFLYEMSSIKRMLFSALLMILYILFEIIIGLILTALSSMTVEQLSQNIFFYIQGVLISKLAMFVLIRAFTYFSEPTDVRVSNAFYIALMVHPVATFLVIFVMSEYMYQAYAGRLLKFSALAVIILIVSNILLFYLFEHYQKLMAEKTREQMVKQDLEYKAEYYKELSNKQKITNKTMHDLKNQLFALKESLERNTNDGVKRINDICDDILLSSPIAFTGNEAVDALITVKKEVMDAKKISFQHSIYLAKSNKIDMYDMCIILGNLLDNAIEANELVDEEHRNIELHMRQIGNYISIRVVNTFNGEVKINKGKIITTKAHKDVHGFGLKSVEEVAKKYNGSCVWNQEKQIFSVVIMLENA